MNEYSEIIDRPGMAILRCADLEDLRAKVRALGLEGVQFYLASPISKRVERARVRGFGDIVAEDCARDAEAWVAKLLPLGIAAVSPISQSVRAVQADRRVSPDILDVPFWMDWSAKLLRASQAVIVPPIDGASESVGILEEIKVSIAADCPVFIIEGE